MRSRASTKSPTTSVRCAIYTRKSSEEGLEQEFNSLDAQREAAEAFIKSQQHEGWVLGDERYDDGGFTGGNMDRPALQRLMTDITEGRIQCVVVYKVDRLSRSLLDFARMMGTFEKHKVAFVSVTQQFNTASSMGRLVLNVLLSFAQFEREIISERTRDKIAATRRKGKWSGGAPILGYDVDRLTTRLVINEPEAERVRGIFDLYRQHRSLLPVVEALAERGWRNKAWQTRKGHVRGGNPFTRTSLHQLLTNVLYAGQIRYKTEVHPAVHPAIMDPVVWTEVQEILRSKHSAVGPRRRNAHGFPLVGLLRCGTCNRAMSPTVTHRPGGRRLRYYVCGMAQAQGRSVCPAPSLPAGEIERYVVEQIFEEETIAKLPEALRAEISSLQLRWVQIPPRDHGDHLIRVLDRVVHDGVRGTIALVFRTESSLPEMSCPPS